MARITLVVPAHLCMVPRPQKEAVALQELGHEVVILGVWFDEEMATLDLELARRLGVRYQPVVDLRGMGLSSTFGRFISRISNRCSKYLYKSFSTVTPSLFGLGVGQLCKSARSKQGAITIGHGEAGLFVVNELSKNGQNVGVDFEDWYSEDLLPSARVHRPIKHFQQMELKILAKAKYCITTSKALSQSLSQSTPPRVVYNSFPDEFRPDEERHASSPIQFCWFSQTIGPGRGLEGVFEALGNLSPTLNAQFLLIGNLRPEYEKWWNELIPLQWRDLVKIQESVPPWELHQQLCKSSVGLALETNKIPSRNYTITNKVFQYLQAGLQVIATPTLGQQEVLSDLRSHALLIKSWDSTELAQAIEHVCLNPPTAKTASEIVQYHDENFSWNQQKLVIQNEIERALK